MHVCVHAFWKTLEVDITATVFLIIDTKFICLCETADCQSLKNPNQDQCCPYKAPLWLFAVVVQIMTADKLIWNNRGGTEVDHHIKDCSTNHCLLQLVSL